MLGGVVLLGLLLSNIMLDSSPQILLLLLRLQKVLTERSAIWPRLRFLLMLKVSRSRERPVQRFAESMFPGAVGTRGRIAEEALHSAEASFGEVLGPLHVYGRGFYVLVGAA